MILPDTSWEVCTAYELDVEESQLVGVLEDWKRARVSGFCWSAPKESSADESWDNRNDREQRFYDRVNYLFELTCQSPCLFV